MHMVGEYETQVLLLLAGHLQLYQARYMPCGLIQQSSDVEQPIVLHDAQIYENAAPHKRRTTSSGSLLVHMFV